VRPIAEVGIEIRIEDQDAVARHEQTVDRKIFSTTSASAAESIPCSSGADVADVLEVHAREREARNAMTGRALGERRLLDMKPPLLT
jgi:hypothetical protein